MTDDLRTRLVEAFRAAAHDCPGGCGQTETECVEAHPIQVEVLHFDQVAVISGPVEHLADVAARVTEAEQEAYEEQVVGSLNERNIRDARRAGRAEAQVARIRLFLEDMAGWCSPHGVAAGYARRGLDALDGVDPLGVADEAEDHSYRDMVNAPLRPETIAALAKRIKAGNLPVRKVSMRGSYPAKPGRATVAADRCPQCGGDNTEAWALCGTCETAGEQQ